jgi:hypothetical protein
MLNDIISACYENKRIGVLFQVMRASLGAALSTPHLFCLRLLDIVHYNRSLKLSKRAVAPERRALRGHGEQYIRKES